MRDIHFWLGRPPSPAGGLHAKVAGGKEPHRHPHPELCASPGLGREGRPEGVPGHGGQASIRLLPQQAGPDSTKRDCAGWLVACTNPGVHLSGLPRVHGVDSGPRAKVRPFLRPTGQQAEPSRPTSRLDHGMTAAVLGFSGKKGLGYGALPSFRPH